MSAPTKRDGPLDRDFWHGYLTVENHADVAERLRRMLDGKRYTFVSIHDGHPALNDVRTSQKLTDPMRVKFDDGHAHIWFADGRYVWGISTSAKTESEARTNRGEKRYDWTALSFSDDYKGERVVIEQVNGYSEPLQWIVQVEDHSEDAP